MNRATGLEAVFRGLDDHGVSWCLLRPALGAATEDEVDLLVAPDDRKRMRDVLRSIGFAPIPAWGHGSHLFFIGFDQRTGQWAHVDIVSELAFGEGFAFETNAAGEVLARRVRHGAVWIPHPDDAFWTLLLHCLLDKETIEVKHRAPLQALSQSADARGALPQRVDEAAGGDRRAAKLLVLVESSDWQKLEAAGRSLAAAWTGRDRTHVAFVRIRAQLARRVSTLVYPLLRRGFGVALLGPDGAGKTTLAGGLESAFPLPAKRLYMGPFQRSARMGVPQRVAIAWSRYLVGFAFRLLGRIVVFERYTLDALLPRRHRLTRVDRARRWLLGHACPAPDFTVLLDAPPELLKERRGEESIDALDDQRRRYLAIARALERSAVVDATRDIETLRRDVVAAIWHAYCRNRRRATTF
jgi:thymidylate kinase